MLEENFSEPLEMVVTGISNTGLGVGRVNGRVYFVPFVLPGERIRFLPRKNFSTYSEGSLVEVLEPSAEREEPRCPHFGRCGGCQYQHMTYRRELELKRFHVQELFQRQLNMPDVRVEETISSPSVYSYRKKITPHYPRITRGDEPIGFECWNSRSLVDIEFCPIATEGINKALRPLREKLHRNGSKRGGTALLREGLEGVTSATRELISESVDLGDRTVKFHFYSGDFFQNNGSILPQVVSYVHRQVLGAEEGRRPRFLVDAYCGVGLFAITAASLFHSVAAVEVNKDAIKLARLNAVVNGVGENLQFYIGSAECIFEEITFPPEETALIIDPPRKGCDKPFLAQLLRFAPRRLVYVSCSPQTQIRDLVELLPFYRLESVQPFDFFPRTRHIENVVTLCRREI